MYVLRDFKGAEYVDMAATPGVSRAKRLKGCLDSNRCTSSSQGLGSAFDLAPKGSTWNACALRHIAKCFFQIVILCRYNFPIAHSLRENAQLP